MIALNRSCASYIISLLFISYSLPLTPFAATVRNFASNTYKTSKKTTYTNKNTTPAPSKSSNTSFFSRAASAAKSAGAQVRNAYNDAHHESKKLSLGRSPTKTSTDNPEKSKPAAEKTAMQEEIAANPTVLAPKEATSVEALKALRTKAAAIFCECKEDEENGYQPLSFKAVAVKAGSVPELTESDQATFDLPGGTVAVSSIPNAEGLVHAFAKTLVAARVFLPGVGFGTIVANIEGTPITSAQHKQTFGQQTEPHIYPPFTKGRLLRLSRTHIPDLGDSDIVFFMPQPVMQRVQATEPLVLGANSTQSKPQKLKNVKSASPEAAAVLVALEEGASYLLSILPFGGHPVAVIGAPLIIGGVGVYCTVKFYQERKARIEHENNNHNGCGNTTPNITPPTACGDTNPVKPDTPSIFPITTPIAPNTTSCGDTQSTNPDTTKGCGNTTPVFPDLVSHKLVEADVKAKFGKVLDNICKDQIGLEVGQKGLNHTSEGHLDGGPLVFKDPNKPKTLFNSEQEIPDLMVETIQKGTVSQNDQAYEYDFGRPIGKTVTGKPLQKVRVVVRYNHQTGKNELVTMYPIE